MRPVRIMCSLPLLPERRVPAIVRWQQRCRLSTRAPLHRTPFDAHPRVLLAPRSARLLCAGRPALNPPCCGRQLSPRQSVLTRFGVVLTARRTGMDCYPAKPARESTARPSRPKVNITQSSGRTGSATRGRDQPVLSSDPIRLAAGNGYPCRASTIVRILQSMSGGRQRSSSGGASKCGRSRSGISSQLQYNLSDRIRYYWSDAQVVAAQGASTPTCAGGALAGAG